MKSIKLCIFDMDGLLLDTERYVWFNAEKKAAKMFDIEMPDEFIRSLIGSNPKIFRSRLIEHFGEDFNPDPFANKVFETAEYMCTNEKIPVKEGVIKTIEFLKANNIKLAVGTSTRKSIAIQALKNSGLYNYFDFVVYGDEVTKGKPDPETYLKAVNHFGFKPEECIVFEDSPIGSKAAYSANINLVFVKDLPKPTELEYEKALAILNQIDEIIPKIKELNNIN